MKDKLKSFSGAKGLFFAMVAVVVVLCGLGIAAVVVGNNMLKTKTNNLLALKIDSKTLDEQQRALVSAKKDIEKYSELESTAKAIVPQEKDQARTVREIIKLAGESGIIISNISFPSSSLGQTRATTAPTTNRSTAQAQPKSTTSAPTQVIPVPGINGVYQMEINVASTGKIPYKNLLDFLSRLENNRRTSQVTNISVQPDSRNRNLVTFNLKLNVYIKP
jgi:hypothetical protein